LFFAFVFDQGQWQFLTAKGVETQRNADLISSRSYQERFSDLLSADEALNSLPRRHEESQEYIILISIFDEICWAMRPSRILAYTNYLVVTRIPVLIPNVVSPYPSIKMGDIFQ
jgi:hypothetical protein